MAATLPIDVDDGAAVTILIPANAIRPIQPKKLVLTNNGGGDTTVAIAAGARMLTGPMNLDQGGAVVLDGIDDLETLAGEDLLLVQTGTADFGGYISYKVL